MTSGLRTRMLLLVLPESERIGNLLCSLSEPALRTAFLLDYLRGGEDPRAAGALNELCARSARGDPAARAPTLAICILLSSLGEHPVLDRLGQTAAALKLYSLGRLLRRAPELRVPTESNVRTPDYTSGRELSLGERKALARRPSRKEFDKLLRDPHPMVILQLLGNPRLTENDVIRLAALRPASAEALRTIARTSWLCRPRVRMALLQNPKTPSAVAIPLIGACTRPELLELCRCSDCSPALREAARELISEREQPGRSVQPSSSSSSSQRSSAPNVTLDAHASQSGGSS